VIVIVIVAVLAWPNAPNARIDHGDGDGDEDEDDHEDG
jgi:hypothetical protein